MARFGASVVFMDIDSIGYGADFASEIRRALEGADALVPVIGPGWTGPQPGGRARIHEADDPVRIEIETALGLGLRIVPVLVEGTAMPYAAALPPSIAGLSALNAVVVDPGRDFDVHIGRLITALSRPARRPSWRRPVYAAAAVVTLGLAGLAGWWLSRDGGADDPARLALTDTECAGLRGLVAEAPQRFMGLRGIIRGQDFWEAPVRIDGFDACFVGTGLGPAVTCERAIAAGERRAEMLDAYAASAATCLGQGWTALSGDALSRTIAGKDAGLLIKLDDVAGPAPLLPEGGKATHKLNVLVSALKPEPGVETKCQQVSLFLGSAANGFAAFKGMPDEGGGYAVIVTPAMFDRCRIVPVKGRLEMACDVATAVADGQLAQWMDANAQFYFACLGSSFAVEGVDARSRVIRSTNPGTGEIRMTIAPQTPPADRPLMTGLLRVTFAPP